MAHDGAMNTSAKAIHSLVDLTKSIASAALRIDAASWDTEAANRCAGDLERLLDYASNLELDPLRSPALALYADFCVLIESELPPTSAQCSVLHRIGQDLLGALAQCAPQAAVSNGKCVYALASSPEQPAQLADELHREGFDLRWFTDSDALQSQMRVQMPQAMLVQVSLLSATAELIDKLVEKAPETAQVPLIAIGEGDDSQRLKALISGAAFYVDGFQDPTLGRQLRAFITEQVSTPYRVLLVDDDRSITEFCSIILRRAGIECLAVQVADEVLPAVRSFQPDLVLMDLYMPGEDGMSLTLQLRQQADALVLPIVFLSGEQSSEVRFRAIQAGGDDFLTKPIRPRHLLSAVRSRIKRVRALSRQLRSASNDNGAVLRRGHFLSSLGEQLTLEDQEGTCALLAIGVDQASALDSRLGMAAEYELEQALAQRLLQCCDPADRLCLWQEFGFGLLVRRQESKAITELAEAMCLAIAQMPFKVEGENMALSVSVGIANCKPGPAAGVDPWIGTAFAALAAAQRCGGNRVEGLLGVEVDEMPPERALWLRELLHHAARGVGLLAEFQPVLALRGQAQGLYALQLRLRDRRQPLVGVARGEYLKLARSQGVLPQIERIALTQALEALDEQRSRGHLANVSVPIELGCFNRTLLTWLEDEIKRRGYKGQFLSIEFDGQTLIERPPLIAIVKRLRQDGVRVHAIDRSGEMASLEALQALPLDGLRLSAGHLLATRPELITRLIDRWHAGGRVIIVDGVDEVSLLANLWSLGVDYLQGDSVAAPGPRLDFDFSEHSG